MGDCASDEIFNNLDFWTNINNELNVTANEDIPDFQCKFISLLGTFFPANNKITMTEWLECWSDNQRFGGSKLFIGFRKM